LINKLVKSERVLTGPEAGITRDAISIDWQYKDTKIKLIDTAGIRKKIKVESQIEKLSLDDSFRAIQYANVVILLIDADMPLESQDVAIANKVIEEGRALVIAINKWDKIVDKLAFAEQINYKIDKSFNQVRGINICYVSAASGNGIDKLMASVIEMYSLWNMRVSTSKINDWLSYALAKHQLPLTKLGKRIKVKYATQVKSRPPTFVLFTNHPKEIPDSYSKYLVGSLRDYLKLPAIPIRILYKKSDNPFNNQDDSKVSHSKK
jgi:GTP-binding protein